MLLVVHKPKDKKENVILSWNISTSMNPKGSIGKKTKSSLWEALGKY